MPMKYLLKRGIFKSVLLLLCLVISSILCPMAIDHSNLANDQDTINNSNILYFPTVNPDRDLQTTVSITNTECKSKQRRANVTLTAYDKDGSSLGVLRNVFRLRANKTKTVGAHTLPIDTKSLTVESNSSLIGNAIFKTTDGKKSEVVPAIKEPARQLDFPALASYDDLYIYETITFLNPNTKPSSVNIVALDKDGYEIDRNALPSLSSMESKTFSLVDIFGPKTLRDLSTVRVISDSDITGLQLVDYPEVDLVGLPALTTTSKVWTLPIATQGENFDLWIKVGILNPGNDIAHVAVEAFDISNNSLGIIDSQSLSPGATYFLSTLNANIADGVIPLNTAFLKVTSDQPVSGYEIIGVVDGKGLTAALGIPEEDQTTVGFEITGSDDGNVLNAYLRVKMENRSVNAKPDTNSNTTPTPTPFEKFEVKHVIIIDIDGLRYDVLYDNIDSLPNFKSLVGENFSRSIKVEKCLTGLPSVTMTGQATLFTGCYAPKHRIFGNICFDRLVPDFKAYFSKTSILIDKANTDVGVPTIYEQAATNGFNSIIVYNQFAGSGYKNYEKMIAECVNEN